MMLLVYGSKTKNVSDNLLRRLKETRTPITVIEVDQRVDRALSYDGAVFHTFEDYLSERDLEDIDERAAVFSRSWYRVNDKDVTRFDGVSEGAVLELDVFFRALLIYKNLECASRIFSMRTISHIYIGSGVSIVPEAWKLIARHINIEYTILTPDTETEDKIREKSIFPRIIAHLKVLKPEHNPVVNSDSKIILATKEGRSTCGTWFDSLRKTETICLTPLKPEKSYNTIFRSLVSFFSYNYYIAVHKNALRSGNAFTYNGLDIWPLWEPDIKTFFRVLFPLSHLESLSLSAWIKKYRVSGLITTWHEHRRAFFEVARANGIPYIVLQDSWLPGEHFPSGYRRFMLCDHLLVWGEISESWSRHIDGVKTHIVGNPQSITLNLKKKDVRTSANGRPMTILLTHQCWGPWTAFHSPLDTNDMWASFAETAKEFPDVGFVGKIHPLVDDVGHEGPGRSAEIMEWAASLSQKNFEVLPLKSSMQEALDGSDVVVTYYSLTAIEALAKGIPVVMMNLTKKRDLFPELVDIGGVTAVHSTEDMIRFVDAIKNKSVDESISSASMEKILEKIFARPVDISSIVLDIFEGCHRH